MGYVCQRGCERFADSIETLLRHQCGFTVPDGVEGQPIYRISNALEETVCIRPITPEKN